MSDPKDPPKLTGGASFLAGILKNAAKTPKTQAAPAGLETRVCSQCGAARAEGSDLTTCEYCGGSYLPTESA